MKDIIIKISRRTGYTNEMVKCYVNSMLDGVYIHSRTFGVITVPGIFDIRLHSYIFNKKIYGEDIKMVEGAISKQQRDERTIFKPNARIVYKKDGLIRIGTIYRVFNKDRLIVSPVIKITTHKGSNRILYYKWVEDRKGLVVVNVCDCGSRTAYVFIKSNIHKLLPLISVNSLMKLISR